MVDIEVAEAARREVIMVEGVAKEDEEAEVVGEGGVGEGVLERVFRGSTMIGLRNGKQERSRYQA